MKLKEEVNICLGRLDSAVDGLLGSGPKCVDPILAQHSDTGPKHFKAPVVQRSLRPKVGSVPKVKTTVFREILRPIGGLKPKTKYSMGSDTAQAGFKPDPKGKARVGFPVNLDAGKYGNPGASSSAAGSPVVLRMLVYRGSPLLVSAPVGLSVCPPSVGHSSGGSSGELTVAAHLPERVQK